MCEFLAGLIGVLAGGTVSGCTIWLKYHLDSKKQENLDSLRKETLLHILENPPPGKEWRRLETLARVIGADYQTTTRLLVELGARGSEKENEVWTLKSLKPLN